MIKCVKGLDNAVRRRVVVLGVKQQRLTARGRAREIGMGLAPNLNDLHMLHMSHMPHFCIASSDVVYQQCNPLGKGLLRRMAVRRLQITEHDEAGKLIATYVQMESDEPGLSRIDLIVRRKRDGIL